MVQSALDSYITLRGRSPAQQRYAEQHKTNVLHSPPHLIETFTPPGTPTPQCPGNTPRNGKPDGKEL